MWYDSGMYSNYVVVSVKMPEALKKRIDELAKRRGRTRNGWIVRVLSDKARWRGGKGDGAVVGERA